MDEFLYVAMAWRKGSIGASEDSEGSLDRARLCLGLRCCWDARYSGSADVHGGHVGVGGGVVKEVEEEGDVLERGRTWCLRWSAT